MNFKFTLSAWVLLLMLTFARSDAAMAGAPTDQVRATVDQVLAILKDPSLKSDAVKKDRRARLSKAILPRFDFEEMAKRSLGAEWRQRTAAEQKEFIGLLTDLLKESYVTSIESYHGDKVVYGRESQDGQFAGVDTAVFAQEGEQFAISYRMHLVDGNWRVFDVVIENISIVNNFRSQFRRFLGRSSFEELLRAMRDKISQP